MLLTWASSRSRPSLILNFLQGIADPRITYSGGANGTRVNSAGVIVAATTPRFDYDPVTLAAKGLLVEEARTNLILNNTAMSTQNVTTAATAYTLSFYGTGTITLSGTSTAGPLVGTGAYPNRVTLTFTPTAGTLTLTVSGSVQYAQLEAGSFATSVIINAGSALTRTADSAVMTGTNFSDWYNQSEGTFIVAASAYNSVNGVSSQPSAYGVSDGTSNNFIEVSRLATSAAVRSRVTTGGASQFNSINSSWPVDVIAKVGTTYKVNDFAAVLSGGTVFTDATGTIPAVDRLQIGGLAGAAIWTGHIRTIAFYPQRLPNAQLQALTA